ncbi:MAG: septum formation initiator family protein [Gammaproteobacteria bacterium]|nr:septum formation initiator family protein [Gammaproteobacteria bacterium]MDD9800885.1 septum formation initiator family protein [Gammaproteobacteria bacterium]MDD9816014.1 septum formation initiator family protein [Gammaproteobacteria bacterium]MDD9850599.1 septum formation initiator family protein [Gammaproteobacteria bacterium]MDD9871162.1 septum formation initiator family protein [Gammaproteobacteria bacterium]
MRTGRKAMLVLLALLLVAVAALQYTVWFGERGAGELREKEKQIAALEDKITAAKKRNASAGADVVDLQTGSEAVEERARSEQGMIKEGETYIRVIGPGEQ